MGFLLYINDFNRSSNILDFHLFADDSSLFYKHQNLSTLESDINGELDKINEWLCANRLSLNIENIFNPPQKKLSFDPILIINGKHLKREYSIKYLGIFIDCHLNWKSQVNYIAKQINRSIGTKLRYYLDRHTLITL